MKLPTVVIPAYQPDERLITLIQALRGAGFDSIVTVDDGGGEKYSHLFEQAAELGAVVLRHYVNLGKGRALKTALNYCLLSGLADNGIVTADSDGQHTPEDIMKVSAALEKAPDSLVLGVRVFGKDTPLRSRLGNNITAALFSMINGGKISDTQTGLRAMGKRAAECFLDIDGERYEYEMNMLLHAKRLGFALEQVLIETIYIENNASSHFNVLRDSARIYALLVKFIASSLLCWLVDYGLFTMLSVLFPGQLFLSVGASRAASSFINYSLNRSVVFRDESAASNTILKYYILAAVVLVVSYVSIKVFNENLGINLYVSKIVVDVALYFANFYIQRDFIFTNNKNNVKG